ncbi:MAG: hypothetical protein H6505_02205 [Calditrichaeota bacterium]|nr:hypothetical protein [Calditrichota bacterium]
MSLLRLLTLTGVLWCATAVFAFDRIEADAPSGVVTPTHLDIQLCTPSADAGAGCTAATRLRASTSFGLRHGVNATVATVRFAAQEIGEIPSYTHSAISVAGESIRDFGNESVRTTDSALAVLYSLTAGFVRIVSSSVSALASAIWPF